MGVSDGWKKREWAKGPRPPRWSTVKGIRAMWWVLRDEMTAWASVL
jgi:hypothetical protein